MISKNELKGKPVQFIDKNGATRICKVHRIIGNTLSVATVIRLNGKRYCLYKQKLHPLKNTIFGAIIRKKIVEIEWNDRNRVTKQKKQRKFVA